MFRPRLALPTKSVPVPSSSDLCALCVSAFSSPNVDALDAASSISPSSATLTKNTRGGGTSQSSEKNSNRNLPALNFQLLVLSAVEGSAFNRLSPNSRRIRTSAKHSPNPFGIRSIKTQDLKPFRMCSSKKTGVGSLPSPRLSAYSAPTFTQVRSGGHPTRSSTFSFRLSTVSTQHPSKGGDTTPSRQKC
jgi:hypothetical protein